MLPTARYMRLFVACMAVLLILSSCVDQEKIKLKQDLAACQAMVVYLLCLNENDQIFCNEWLCERYPNATVCEEE